MGADWLRLAKQTLLPFPHKLLMLLLIGLPCEQEGGGRGGGECGGRGAEVGAARRWRWRDPWPYRRAEGCRRVNCPRGARYPAHRDRDVERLTFGNSLDVQVQRVPSRRTLANERAWKFTHATMVSMYLYLSHGTLLLSIASLLVLCLVHEHFPEQFRMASKSRRA
jgi:hypothetical protein